MQKSLGQEEGLLVLECIEERVPPERRPELVEGVARQRDVAEVKLEIEKVRAEIEKVRAELNVRIEQMQAVQTRWAFVFWLSQMAVLGGLLVAVLRLFGQV